MSPRRFLVKVERSSQQRKVWGGLDQVRFIITFVIDRSKGSHGCQTIGIAETADHALDIASESNNWEVLDFTISDFQVFLNTPL